MRYWIAQVGRASSRLLNALTGGEGDSTFSAWSWHLKIRNKRTGSLRVRVVDFLVGTNHCQKAYDWHVERRLLERD